MWSAQQDPTNNGFELGATNRFGSTVSAQRYTDLADKISNMANTSTKPVTTPTDAHQSSRRFDLLAFFALLSILTLAVGGWFTSMGFGPWYDELKKPPFQPPGWVFSPAWTTIFCLLAVATWQVARAGKARTALWLYALQLLLNVTWSLLFFALARPMWALVEIVVLTAIVAAMVYQYSRIRRAAGLMLVPYVVWLLFATALNAWIVMNN